MKKLRPAHYYVMSAVICLLSSFFIGIFLIDQYDNIKGEPIFYIALGMALIGVLIYCICANRGLPYFFGEAVNTQKRDGFEFHLVGGSIVYGKTILLVNNYYLVVTDEETKVTLDVQDIEIGYNTVSGKTVTLDMQRLLEILRKGEKNAGSG